MEEDGGGQITIYAGRGLNVESTEGNIWLYVTSTPPTVQSLIPWERKIANSIYSWGTSSEHCVLYQYQFAATTNVFMGQIQTESAFVSPDKRPDCADPPANVSLLGIINRIQMP